VAAGLGMTIVESYLSWRGMGHEAPTPILANLARGMVVIQLTFFVAMFEGLIVGHKLPFLVDGSYEMWMWWLETLVWTVIPAVVVFNRRWIGTRTGVFVAGFSYVLGFLLNRINITITALEGYVGSRYMPSWQEIAVSASFVVVAFIVFAFAVKYFDLFEEEEHEGAAEHPAAQPA